MEITKTKNMSPSTDHKFLQIMRQQIDLKASISTPNSTVIGR